MAQTCIHVKATRDIFEEDYSITLHLEEWSPDDREVLQFGPLQVKGNKTKVFLNCIVIGFLTLVITQQHLLCDGRVFSLWLDQRPTRRVELHERKVDFKEMLANDSVGEIGKHEWLDEMLMGVNFSCTQLEVTVLKLTVTATQICNPLESSGVVCTDMFGTSLVHDRVELTEYVHNITSDFSSMEGIRSIFLSSSVLFSGEMGSGSWVRHTNFRLVVILHNSGSCSSDCRWESIYLCKESYMVPLLLGLWDSLTDIYGRWSSWLCKSSWRTL